MRSKFGDSLVAFFSRLSPHQEFSNTLPYAAVVRESDCFAAEKICLIIILIPVYSFFRLLFTLTHLK